ncbi:hypothetical protein C8R43DRAFT_1197325 [Mycena crocata]|nr:hypothetical protein C8R43DRAFT_1197325 [Mycena crocata]
MSRTKPIHRIVPLCLTHHAVVNRSPCPDLLLCNETPSTSQIDEVNEAIRRDEEDMSATDTAITRFQYMLDRLGTNAIRQDEADIFATNTAITRLEYLLDRLRTRRLQLQEFAERHRVMMSTFHPPTNIMWRIIQVSVFWRATALALPHLWRHFVFKDKMRVRDDDLVRAISLQVRWSNPTPLAIRIEKSQYHPAILDHLAAASARWEDTSLRLFPAAYKHLFAHANIFSAVKRLEFSQCSDYRRLESTNKADFIAHLPALPQFIKSLPALEELVLYPNQTLLSTSTIPWHRFCACTLMDCRTPDVLHILSRLTTGTRVSISSSSDHDSSAVPAVSSLSLEELVVTGSAGKPSIKLGHHIFSLLDRSACPLTRLHITVPLTEDTLLCLLASQHLRGLVDLNLLGSGPISAQGIDAVTRSVFPSLSTIAFRSSAKVEESDVLSMLATGLP